MDLTICTASDFHQILTDIVDFWGSTRTLALHHPFLLREFGNTAFVIKRNERVLAYLFGFYSQTEPIAYVHLVGVRTEARRQGLARNLYDHFIELARQKGCQGVKAITTPTNSDSIRFHRSLGMTLLGEENVEGIPVIRDYSGPGQDRVVFYREI